MGPNHRSSLSADRTAPQGKTIKAIQQKIDQELIEINQIENQKERQKALESLYNSCMDGQLDNGDDALIFFDTSQRLKNLSTNDLVITPRYLQKKL